MITEQERNDIVDEAVEKTLLLLPETVGNLITNHLLMTKLNQKFYSEHPEFTDHKDAVVSVIEKVEGQNPLAKYEDILQKAVPDIKKRIDTLKSVNLDTVSQSPDRGYEPLPSMGGHGEL